MWYTVNVRLTYKYRLYPSKEQERRLSETLETCRLVYNSLLNNRKYLYETTGKGPSKSEQQAMIARWKPSHPELTDVHSQVLQNVAVRVDLAFDAFFRRVKRGDKPGFPRFKNDGYDSFTFPQSGFEVGDSTIMLSKVGKVKAKVHRPIFGQVKTCTVRRQSGKWFACFSVECQAVTLPVSIEPVGIDVGLSDFAYLSTGDPIANPRFYRCDEKDLKRIQRKVSKASGHARRKARKALSKVHRRIANRRNNFAHQESRKIVNRFGFIAVEDIHTNRMVHNHCLAKSIMDAAWSQFFGFLTYKAESAGRKMVKVNPAYTSQDCHRCGHRQKMPLSARLYECPCCELSINRDHNAALNILALGQQSVGIQSVEAP
jgi:putative transposase